MLEAKHAREDSIACDAMYGYKSRKADRANVARFAALKALKEAMTFDALLSLLTALSSEREAGERNAKMAFVNGYVEGFSTGKFEPDLSQEDVYGGAAHKAGEYLTTEKPHA